LIQLFLNGDDGKDKISGGAGNASIDGGYGKDVIDCGPGRDTVYSPGGDRVKNCEERI
jgi:Ca2+-binding RTX toxin-like protein